MTEDTDFIQMHFESKETLEEQRKKLPVFFKKESLLWLLETHRVLIVVGETGSGKSTQIPQYLYENNWASQGYCIAVTQPRKIACLSLAKRVSTEMDVTLGQEVGYIVRFDNSTSEKTKIKFMTDGILFRELLIDPLLTSYSVVMIDEAHERSIYTDLLLAILKKIMKKRPELKLIISSASQDDNKIVQFFENKKQCAIINIQGNNYDVDVYYLNSPCLNYLDKSVEVILQIHEREKRGDILVFLTGRDDIQYIKEYLKTETKKTINKSGFKLNVLSLYAGMTLTEQEAVLQKTVKTERKVILATNIAETSLTIDGVVYVIDCGFHKTKTYNYKNETYSLTIIPISKAQAKQRAGRAGRLQNGKVYRLYTEESYDQLLDQTIPDIQKSDSSMLILQLKALGIDNVTKFDFLSPPPSKLFSHALEYLYNINAIDIKGNLTKNIGVKLSELPLTPDIGKLLIESEKYECSEEISIICAIVSSDDVFTNVDSTNTASFNENISKFITKEGDHISFINIFRLFQKNHSQKWCKSKNLNYSTLSKAVFVHQQLKTYMKKMKIKSISCNKDTIKIRKCLITAYFRNVAEYNNVEQYYVSIKDKMILYPHPTSVLFNRVPKLVIYHEMIETTKPYMKHITAIEKDWLTEVLPHVFSLKQK